MFALFVYLSIVAAYFAWFASLYITSWVRDLAESRGFVDRPDTWRKTQKTPVAYGGGTAVLLATAVALVLVAHVSLGVAGDNVDYWSLLGLASASVVIWVVGLYDDLYNMRGVTKLVWQLLAACLVVAPGSGLLIEQIDVLGYGIDLGHIGIPLGVLWILAAVNSLNLLDGMDGLASTVGLLFSITIGTMALMTGSWLEATIAFALAGSLLGFLWHNWPPARIYLGDSGSMLIGLVLGALAIRCEVKDATTIAVAGPLAIFAIPFMDSAAAIVRRKLTGRSMYSTDRGHIHHRLLTQGLSNQQALFLIAGLCAITCLGSVLNIYLARNFDVRFPLGLASVALVVIILLGTRIFGHSELMLLNSRLAGFGRYIFPNESPRADSVRLQGTMEWEEVWQGLIASTRKLNLMKLRLNLHLPQLHEDFYATWRRRSRTRADRRWTMEVPLVVDNSVVGTLSVVGVQDDGSVAPRVSDLAELVVPLEKHLEQVLRPTDVSPQSVPSIQREPATLEH